MDLISLVILLGVLAIVLVVAFFLINQFQMDPAIRRIVTIVLVIVIAVVAIWILLSLRGGNLHIAGL